MLTKPIISVIIPVLNEEKNLTKNINKLPIDEQVELIFVDGGSRDNTVSFLENKGLTVIESPIAQRSYQMNLGAEKAEGEILLFLHGDSILPNNYCQLIQEALNKKGIIAGAFSLQIDEQKSIFRLLENLVNWRSSFLQLPYGDQGIFIRKETFKQVKGYSNLAIMEDFNLIKKLQKLGQITIIKNPVITSARRWQKLGILRTTIINQLVIIGYYLRIDTRKLAQLYRRN